MAASTRNFRPGRVARSLRWLVAGAVFAIVAGCGGGSASAPSATGGGGGGSGDGGGDGGGGGPVTTGLKLVPPRLGLTVGSDGRLLAVNAGAMPSWMSSDARVATVDSEGRVQAVAKGSAVITATSGSEVATSTLTVYQTEGPSPDATSESLIDAALAQNRIDAETALTYRVFAVFGDERLPIAYEGAPSAAPPHLLLRELMTTIGTLSPAAQAVLRPFLLPPIYADSWFAQRLGLGASAQASAQHRATAARAKALSTVNCAVGIAPSLYAKVSTVHFNVYYTVFGGTSYVAENAKSAAAAAMVAAIIEQGLRRRDQAGRSARPPRRQQGSVQRRRREVRHLLRSLRPGRHRRVDHELRASPRSDRQEERMRPPSELHVAQQPEHRVRHRRAAAGEFGADGQEPPRPRVSPRAAVHDRPRGELQGPGVARRGHRAVGDGPPRAHDRPGAAG
jgi:hypothetical protein